MSLSVLHITTLAFFNSSVYLHKKREKKRKDNIKGDFSNIRMTDQEQFVVKICSYKMLENIGIIGQGQLTVKGSSNRMLHRF